MTYSGSCPFRLPPIDGGIAALVGRLGKLELAAKICQRLMMMILWQGTREPWQNRWDKRCLWCPRDRGSRCRSASGPVFQALCKKLEADDMTCKILTKRIF